jgi:RNA polymerase sigma-70 factor (ECF subfamily)
MGVVGQNEETLDLQGGAGQPGAPDAAPPTLGDVLYPDRGRTVASEAEWVALVGAVAGGDQLALHALYERANRVVFTLIVRLTNNRETAEELTLDVFYDVWRRASLYDAANGTVLGWIMNQARSRAIDRLRFDHRKKRVDPNAGDPSQGAEASGQHVPDFEEQGRTLRAALMVLTPEERQAIEAAFFSELTHAEVAARFNVPLGTIKTRIRSGLFKLRHALGARGNGS